MALLGLDVVIRGAKAFQRDARMIEKSIDGLDKRTSSLAKLWAGLDKKINFGKIAKGWREVEQSSKQLGGIWDKSAAQLTAVQVAVQKFGKVNITVFDALAKRGMNYGLAMKFAGKAAQVQATISGTLKTVLAGVATNIGLVVAGFTALVAIGGVALVIIKSSIAAFHKEAQEIRLLHMQLGISIEKTSQLAQAARLAGVETRFLIQGISMFEKKLQDFELRMASGSEESHEFERALKALGIEAHDTDGAMREMDDILLDLAGRFEELGPGVLTTGIAMNLFGRTGRQLLPWLLQGKEGLEEYMRIAKEFGVVLTEKDVKASNELREATVKLDMAMDGMKNMIARTFIPVLEDLKEKLAEVINTARQAIIIIAASTGAILAWSEAILTGKSVIVAADWATQAFTTTVRDLTGALTDVEKAAQAEEAALNKREQTITTARNRLIALEEDMLDVQERLAERRLDMERQFTEQWEDIIIQRSREIEDAARQAAQRLADIWRNYYRRIDDILDNYNKRRAEILKGADKDRKELQDKLQDKLEDLLEKHLQRMADIRQQFLDTAEEAARRRDAIAYLRAKRQRNRDLRDERKDYARRRAELIKDWEKRLDEIDKALADQLQDLEDNLADQIAAAKKARQRQLEDLELALAREREARALAWARQEEDLDRSKKRQEEALRRWYFKEDDALREKYERQLEIIEKAGGDIEWSITLLYSRLLAHRMKYYQDLLEMDKRAQTLLDPFAFTPPRRIKERGAGRGLFTRAEGGIDVVRKPTTFLAGEAGPEVAAFIPLKGSVHHTFGQLQGDISGVSPQSEAQIVGMITKVLYEYARQL